MRYFGMMLCLIMAFSLTAQDTNKIVVESGFWKGTKIFKGSLQLDKEMLYAEIANNDEAYELAQKGFRQQSTSQVFASIGGFMIGWPLGAAVAGSDNPGWGLIPAGVGVIMIGWPIYNSGSKKIKKAARMYNEAEGLTHFRQPSRINLSLVTNANGVGFRLRF